MLTPVDFAAAEPKPLAEPQQLGELLPEVLARYGLTGGANATVHAAHGKPSPRHRGPGKTEKRETQRPERPRAIRLPSAKRRLSAAG